MLIKEIRPEDTWYLRNTVLWPDKNLDYVKLEEDKSGYHYGLFVDSSLVSVISVFINDDRAQFRKFATNTNEQGNGYGTRLLQFVMNKADEYRIKTIWCNARADKTSFYERFGMKVTETTFAKDGVDYVQMIRSF